MMPIYYPGAKTANAKFGAEVSLSDLTIFVSTNFVFHPEHQQVDLIGNAISDSEEIVIDEGEKYVAVFDPLDGSSNVDAGIPTGTIIGVSHLQNLKHEANSRFCISKRIVGDEANTTQLAHYSPSACCPISVFFLPLDLRTR
jgi:hypothetical protein